MSSLFARCLAGILPRGGLRLSLLVTAPVLLLAACQPDTGGNVSGPPRASLSQTAEDPAPSQMAVAAEVPGFGGYFLDESGAPTVYLTDPSQRPAAEAALAGFLADRGFTASDLVVRQASYGYAQLDAWYRAARVGAFQVSGILTGDVDEANNRISFGVVDAGAVDAVQAAALAAGVPAAALGVRVRAPFATVATLRDNISPRQGGIQINFLHASGVRTVSFLCTLGFNAVIGGVSSFITNSHCSTVEGGSETGTEYYQPLMDPDGDRLVNPENKIADEAHDPHWSISADCFGSPALQCRWSDASRAAYLPGQAVQLGRIARTTRQSTSLTDVVLDINGYFSIRAEQNQGVVGEIANKVGRTTGWTSGRTTETCVDVLALGTTHIRLCQEIVGGVVAGGDSGSPVFRIKNGKSVVLLGVLWGGSVDESNPEFVYSPMFGIERELGLLTTF